MDIMGLMKKAQEMQGRMQEMQAEMERVDVEGASGGGMVRVTMSAKGSLKALTIDPSLMKLEEKDILEDLVIAAHEDARKKGEAIVADKMKAATAGLPLPPGMKLPF